MKIEHYLPEITKEDQPGTWWTSVKVNLKTQEITMNYQHDEECHSTGFFEVNNDGDVVVTYTSVGKNTNYTKPYIAERPDLVKLIHDWYDYIILGNDEI